MSNKVSVIIPNYNRKEALKRAVESVLKQEFDVFEILIVDDGSERDALRFAQDHIAKLSDRVKIIEITHCGHPGKVRNIGVHYSTGDWIAFLDSDDEWLPNRLLNQFNRIALTNAIALGDSTCNWKQNGHWRVISSRALKDQNLIICSSVLLRKEVFERVNGFPESIFSVGVEDYVLWLKIASVTNWHLSGSKNVINNLDGESSLSRSPATQNRFQSDIGALIFADWKYRLDGERRMLLALCRKLMRLLT